MVEMHCLQEINKKKCPSPACKCSSLFQMIVFLSLLLLYDATQALPTGNIQAADRQGKLAQIGDKPNQGISYQIEKDVNNNQRGIFIFIKTIMIIK